MAETGLVEAAWRQINVGLPLSAASGACRSTARYFLFDRSGHNLKLSPAGETLLRELRDVSQWHEETLEHLDALRGLKRERVRVATVESLTASVLLEMLAVSCWPS